MALIDAFLAQTVTIRPFIRVAAGEPIYGETEMRKCRMEFGQNHKTVYKNPDGQIDVVIAEAKLFCTGAEIPTRSIVTYAGREYTVIRCTVLRGFTDDHLEVYLQ